MAKAKTAQGVSSASVISCRLRRWQLSTNDSLKTLLNSRAVSLCWQLCKYYDKPKKEMMIKLRITMELWELCVHCLRSQPDNTFCMTHKMIYLNMNV